MGEIFCRATIKYGELSKSLDKAERKRTDLHPTGGKQTKADQLKASGLSKMRVPVDGDHRFRWIVITQSR